MSQSQFAAWREAGHAVFFVLAAGVRVRRVSVDGRGGGECQPAAGREAATDDRRRLLAALTGSLAERLLGGNADARVVVGPDGEGDPAVLAEAGGLSLTPRQRRTLFLLAKTFCWEYAAAIGRVAAALAARGELDGEEVGRLLRPAESPAARAPASRRVSRNCRPTPTRPATSPPSTGGADA